MPVRDAVEGDVEEICALIEEHARYEGNDELVLDREDMRRHLFGTDPKAWVLIAEPPGQQGTVAGFAFCTWSFSTWEARPGIWLDDVFIRPEHRRYGLGGELLAELRDRTAGRVEWDMQEGNDRAAAFYKQLGAQEVHGWTRYRWRPARE
ncbi:GNAT family N-acetyltransferase [Amycolatopsis palatopharyngis]|uniref:GNAT family N-acetyltransferase n=1 Tax=Amycolatopsis palatopharyngis TaxID=187982 RepID=UPI000E24986A|nr:GNAT family N-acetyltransferase [Amycolatopsis palatopharyngis]